MHLLLLCLLFSARFWPAWIAKWTSQRIGLHANWADLVPCNPNTSHKQNLPFSQAVSLNGFNRLWGQPAPYNQLQVQPLLLVPEWEVRVLELSANFSFIAVCIGRNIFPQVIVLGLIWYLHLKTYFMTLQHISFKIWK